MKSSRVWGVDYARSFAIVLALASHFVIIMQKNGVLDLMPDEIRLLTRSATPMFVFMFGFMIVFAYRNVKFSLVKKRMWTRSLQCYVAYCLTALSGYIGGYKILIALMAALVMLAQSHFGNILKIYAIILLFAPWLLLIYRKSGLYGLIMLLLLASFWGVFKVYVPDRDVGIFSNILNLIFGIWGSSGPSVAGGIIFVLIGMITAHSLIFSGKKSIFYILVFLILVLILTVIFHPVDTPSEIIFKYIDYSYRGYNSIEYYIIGSVASMFLFVCFILLDPILPKKKLFVVLGASSLLSYTFGNVFLNLTAFISIYIGPFYYWVLFVSCLYFFVLFWSKLPMSAYFERFFKFDWFFYCYLRLKMLIAKRQ